jgi:hypothetical protein
MTTAAAHLRYLHGDRGAAQALVEPIPRGTVFLRDANEAIWALEAGEPEFALSLLPSREATPPNAIGSTYHHALRCRVLLALGRDSEARAEFGEWTEIMAFVRQWEQPGSLSATPVIDDAFSVLADEMQLTDTASFLEGFPAMRGSLLAGAYDQFRGGIALRLSRVDDAEQHFRTGLEWCEREKCPIEAGRCHQGLAEVAARRGDQALAMQYLDAAGELFAKYGAKLYLDQVLAKKEILKA